MTETEAPVEAANLETPGDSPEAQPPKVAKRGRTYRCYKGGDYMPMLASDGSDDLPAGTLSPILSEDAGKPRRFLTLKEAEAWLKANGSAFAGKVIMLMHVKKKFTIIVEAKPKLRLDEAPRTLVTDPSEEVSDG